MCGTMPSWIQMKKPVSEVTGLLCTWYMSVKIWPVKVILNFTTLSSVYNNLKVIHMYMHITFHYVFVFKTNVRCIGSKKNPIHNLSS